MPDEQIIYLDPNDELTKVRERIEEIPARHIILVVPQQTQLRSHVGWRLLHARAREMGKDILVISTDRQVRAVAKAAGFKVADSQESPVSSKTRPGSRPTRGGIGGGGKTTQRPRTQGGRGTIDNRAPRQREQLPPRTRPAQDQPAPNTWREAESRASQVEETRTGQGNAPAPTPFVIEEDDEFDQNYEFRVDPSQSTTVRPMAPRHEDEEPDPLIEDYRTSQRIREAAQSAHTGEMTRPADERALREPTSAMPGPRNTVPPPPDQVHPDPFEEMEDISSVPLPEQRGSTFVHDVDEGIPDISDIPTDVHEIEFLGDQGDFIGTQNIPGRQWPDAIVNEPEEDLPRVYGTRPRSSRSGALPRRPVPEFGDEDLLPPIEDQPTLTPNHSPRPSGSLRRGNRGAQPAAQGPQAPQSQQRPARNVSARPGPPPSRVTPRIGTPVAPPAARRAGSTGRRGGRIATVILVCFLLLLLVGIGLLYFGTTATITITVPSRALSLNQIKLNATTNAGAHGNVTPQVLSYNASVTGQGTATGTTPQGKARAIGNVTFSNTGSQPLIIPSLTLVSTTANPGSAGILFATTAQAVIPVTNANNPPVPVPVQAQNPGGAGNVGPNAINVIPAESITKIASFNSVPTSTIRLSVTNSTGLQGGGAINVPAATKGDIQALTASLHQQLQARINMWLKGQLQKGDIAGKLIPDVLGSKSPLPQEQLTQVPAVGQPLTGKSFTGQLAVHISVLVVRYADLVTAAQNQLNAAALKMQQPYELAMQIPIMLGKNVTSTPSKDGLSISITLSAKGQIVQHVNLDDIRALVAGKTEDQAKSEIQGGETGLHPVETVSTVVSPSFLHLMPFRTEHIRIIIQPMPNG